MKEPVTRALTFTQPWATAKLEFGKDIENRPWAPDPRNIGKRFAVHAGLGWDFEDKYRLKHLLPPDEDRKYPVGILGTVELAGVVRWFETGIVLTRCLSDDQTLYVLGSRWLVKGTKTAWLLRNPIKFETPIPATGSQGLWHLSTSLSEQVTALSRTEGLK